jgi:ABC-type lipoprotein release transport system permease subunit
MPPWPEWQVEYVGSSFLGRLLGLWFAFWIRLIKRLFSGFGKDANNSRRHNGGRAPLSKFQVRAKLYRFAISTVLVLCFWRLATLKPLWSAFNESGHRVIVSSLFLLTAFWMVSVAWICLSKANRRE